MPFPALFGREIEAANVSTVGAGAFAHESSRVHACDSAHAYVPGGRRGGGGISEFGSPTNVKRGRGAMT